MLKIVRHIMVWNLDKFFEELDSMPKGSNTRELDIKIIKTGYIIRTIDRTSVKILDRKIDQLNKVKDNLW